MTDRASRAVMGLNGGGDRTLCEPHPRIYRIARL